MTWDPVVAGENQFPHEVIWLLSVHQGICNKCMNLCTHTHIHTQSYININLLNSEYAYKISQTCRENIKCKKCQLGHTSDHLVIWQSLSFLPLFKIITNIKDSFDISFNAHLAHKSPLKEPVADQAATNTSSPHSTFQWFISSFAEKTTNANKKWSQ